MQKGNVLLYLLFLVVIIAGIGLGWFYLRDQDAFGGLNIPLPFLQPKATFNTAGWKMFKADSEKITFLYPPDWFVTNNQYVSQYPYTPGKFSADIYNAVSVAPVMGQLQTSYANQDWFNTIYNASDGAGVVNQYHVSDQNKVTKVESFRTINGKKAVVFIDQTTQSASSRQAYLFIDSTRMYQFRIDNFDQAGLDYFKKIISTAVVN